ncbi:ADP-ribosylglycohydrolase family protein [Sporomusa sphaeroides]|uniref:ADP-ribosyl-[dinitrogen reductase] glycohydrolase n=1 Tax=Sporomusa sphaeroides DSM 2875 TaxID=1337886 RepID=A0ABM9W088_9FIRM|nr:ADP-ribosylglycohydrolase family protein [Sporomusa sphaeroides]OLS56480.1 ADP-ribosyl-[dinitrogen reductase] glycohydrolase [Sporomusa sphaeroides DSM 2875]CVK18575.1 ADP-ribosyl-[dinitrogen reductase] glycohydrolase [Sporomusa sphaeroides DSM 2875]
MKHNRYRGALLGLATGDALGVTLEGKPPGSFAPITGLIGGGTFALKPGYWTDDTSMALCLAESLIHSQKFDPADQMEHYLRWYKEGYLSSTGSCFSIGQTVRAALETYSRTGQPYTGSEDPRTAGNGSLMRLAPVPLRYAANPALAIDLAADSSRTTHAAPEAVDACRYLAALLIGALQDQDKATLLTRHYSPLPEGWIRPLSPNIAAIAAGSYKSKNPPDIRGTGYVVDCLEAALWAFYHSDSFAEGALLAVNLGDDADTTAAVYGQLAGTYYGANSIPASWLAKVYRREYIEELADSLCKLSAQ